MKKISFPFEEETSPLFGKIYWPAAQIKIWSFREGIWGDIVALVDSGADYTLLPKYLARFAGVDLKRDCEVHPTAGIGGSEKVHLFRKMPVKIGNWQRKIPVGFMSHDEIPPLLGRQDCLEKIGVVLHRRRTIFIL